MNNKQPTKNNKQRPSFFLRPLSVICCWLKVSPQRGFTLIELLVVIAIMIVITTLILARHSQFNGTVLLRNLAYSIALSIRQAQLYGISGKSVGGTIGTQFGVHFDAATNDRYVLFLDADKDGVYGVGEDVEIFTLRNGYRIIDMCANTGTGTVCSAAEELNRLNVVFKRPDPDALFFTDIPNQTYVDVTLTVQSVTGDTRTILVTNTGQIAVQQ